MVDRAAAGDGGADADGDDEVPWRQFFAFDEPYDNQADAVERIVAAGREDGYLAMEGPCGTGKTMAALTAAATLIREDERYERLVVVTPVKQQLQQFVDDLRAVNAGLEDPLDGVALVGKPDLCPYGREGLFADDAGVHDRCEDLRENTAGLVEGDEASGQSARATSNAGGQDCGAGSAGAGVAIEGVEDEDDRWWDPDLAADLATAARPEAQAQQTFGDDALRTAGATSPYRATQPTAPESLAESDDPPTYCPFEADWYARDRGSPVSFSAGRHNVVTADDYLPAAVERGTCPHRVMSVMLGAADVVIGNYNHLFDPKTRPLLQGILDEDAFVVVDEAHRLEGRVRDLLSDRLGRDTIKRARGDCTQLLQHARQATEYREQVEELLGAREVPLEAVDAARSFYDDLLEWLDGRVRSFLDGEHEGWRADPTTLPERDREIPLRDPETVERDDLTAWAESVDYDGTAWRSLAPVGAAVEEALDELGLRGSPVCAASGAILSKWWKRDHAGYLREVELTASPADQRHVDADYETAYTAGLLLYDCMPSRELEAVFDELGGGVLMSATLEPLDVFTHVSGLAFLEEGGEDRDPRPVDRATYDLPFPPENRASWLVDCCPFTAHNRGDPEEMEPLGDGWNGTRDEYAHALRALGRSPGNVMIAMPNYREARWAGAYLDGVLDRPVLVDESSSNEATDRRRRTFVQGGEKVLVTSTRGTLTEGVDYEGDALSTCAVVGVPLVNVGSPRVRAVRRAYGEVFGEDHAFEYALTVPAVRRARQAIGRVIRGTDEVGVRAFVGRRYVPGARHSVYEYLPEDERAEFTRMTPEFLADQIDRFWRDR